MPQRSRGSSFRLVQWVGLTAGLLAGAGVAGSHGVDPDRVLILGLATFSAGVLGAHLLYAIACGERGRVAVVQAARDRSAVLFGVPAGLAVSAPLIVLLDLPVGRAADSIAVAALTATAIGRVACFRRGCCGGRPSASRWTVPARDPSGTVAPRLPTQLLDSASAAVLAAVLVAGPELPAGAAFFAALTGYSACRTLTEYTRAGRPPPPDLSSTQRVLLSAVVVGVVGLACVT